MSDGNSRSKSKKGKMAEKKPLPKPTREGREPAGSSPLPKPVPGRPIQRKPLPAPKKPAQKESKTWKRAGLGGVNPDLRKAPVRMERDKGWGDWNNRRLASPFITKANFKNNDAKKKAIQKVSDRLKKGKGSK